MSVWSPNVPPDNGALLDNSAWWPLNLPWLESAPDNAALSRLGIPNLLDPAIPAVAAHDGDGQSPNDEPNAERSISNVGLKRACSDFRDTG